MDLKKIIDSDLGKYIISILLGLGLASLFRKSCQNKKCLRFVGPPINEIKNKAFKFNNKCYKYIPQANRCNKDKKQIYFS
jgi:hypothetical protein